MNSLTSFSGLPVSFNGCFILHGHWNGLEGLGTRLWLTNVAVVVVIPHINCCKLKTWCTIEVTILSISKEQLCACMYACMHAFVHVYTYVCMRLCVCVSIWSTWILATDFCWVYSRYHQSPSKVYMYYAMHYYKQSIAIVLCDLTISNVHYMCRTHQWSLRVWSAAVDEHHPQIHLHWIVGAACVLGQQTHQQYLVPGI